MRTAQVTRPPASHSVPSSLQVGNLGQASHLAINFFTCQECVLHFQTENELNDHKLQHLKSFQCTMCNKVYSSKSSLRVHYNTHSNAEKFQCSICKKSFLRRSSLYNHMKSHVNAAPRFKCSACDEKFESAAHLSAHEVRRSDRNGFSYHELQCCVCGAILSTTAGLKLHITKMHTEALQLQKQKSFSCQICRKKYTSLSYLRQHLKTHSNAKSFGCSDCDYKALTREAVRRHVIRIHLKLRAYECDICNKTFVSQPDRKLHMLRHYKLKPVQCDECDQRFYSSRELRRHKWAHSGQKPYACQDCQVSYGYLDSLKRHISTHLPQPIECDKCNRKCWSHKLFAKHARSHPSFDNIFKCVDCLKYFKTPRTLSIHQMKSKHSAVVIMCHSCNVEFSSMDLLTAHNAATHAEYTLSAIVYPKKTAQLLTKNINAVLTPREDLTYCTTLSADFEPMPVCRTYLLEGGRVQVFCGVEVQHEDQVVVLSANSYVNRRPLTLTVTEN